MKIYGPYTRKDGRLHVVIINDNGTRQTKSYPRLLVENLLGRELQPEETVDHIDGNFRNNDLSNLRILSRAENAAYSWEIGTARVSKMSDKNKVMHSKRMSAENNILAKFSKVQIEEIRARKKYYGCITIWAKEFNVTPKTLKNILTKVSYNYE